MHLTEANTDALTELLNIGHGRAAAALSGLTGERVELEAPHVIVVPADYIGEYLAQSVSGRVTCVSQAFTGRLAGNAMLLFDEVSAGQLAAMLDGGERGTSDGEGDGLREAGNIFLHACLGAFGNLLQVQITFAVPALSLDSVERILRDMRVAGQELTHAIVGRTQFRIRRSHVSGTLVIVLGLTSFRHLVDGLESWG